MFLGPWILPSIVLLIPFLDTTDSQDAPAGLPLAQCSQWRMSDQGACEHLRVHARISHHCSLAPCSHLARICSLFFHFSRKIPDAEINSCYLCAGCCMNNKTFIFYHDITCQIIKRITNVTESKQILLTAPLLQHTRQVYCWVTSTSLSAYLF